jgi:F-type H+-transporting ATPase subunit delta
MKLSPKQYAQALFEAASETAPKDYDIILERFVKVLVENGDLGKFSEIEAEYKNLEQKQSGVTQGNATFAMEHNVKVLNELNKVVLSKTEYKTQIDEGLVGGVVIRADDTLIDASVKTLLNNLNMDLKK